MSICIFFTYHEIHILKESREQVDFGFAIGKAEGDPSGRLVQ